MLHHDHTARPRRSARPTHPARLDAPIDYSRADAIAQGLLIPIPATTALCHRMPADTAVTARLWADSVAAPTDDQTRNRLIGLLCSLCTAPPDEARTAVAWRSPAGSDHEHTAGRPVRVTYRPGIGDDGERVGTIAHTETRHVGTFTLEHSPAQLWPAVAFGPAQQDGTARPVVTVETLYDLLTQVRTADPTLTASWYPNDRVQICTATDWVWLRPDPDRADTDRGTYDLGPLPWPFRIHTRTAP